MSFPSSWADALFAKLTVRYGAAFLSQWRDADVAIIKADWCDVLAGFEKHPEAIRYALENLPEKPLNAVAFRLIARRSPAPEIKRLPEPPADPEKVAAAIAAAMAEQRSDRRTPAQIVIDGLIDIAKVRGRLDRAQREFVVTCGAMLAADDERQQMLPKLAA